MMIYPAAIPMGNALFITWPQVDELFDRFAKSYFGPHARGEGERDETSCNLSLWGLKPSDYDKFSQLFIHYDTDHDYEPGYEFCTGNQSAFVPTCVTLGVLSDILRDEFQFSRVGNLTAIYDGVFVMENKLDYDRFIKGKSAQMSECQVESKPALEAQIADAADRAAAPSAPDHPARTPEPTH